MPGELVPRKPDTEIESWDPHGALVPRGEALPAIPAPTMDLTALYDAASPPPVQQIYILPPARSDTNEAVNDIVADLSRPVIMLIWGAVLVGLYFSHWWILAADFAKIGVVLFVTLFLTAPHARKSLLFVAAALLGLAFVAALLRPPAPDTVAPAMASATRQTGAPKSSNHRKQRQHGPSTGGVK